MQRSGVGRLFITHKILPLSDRPTRPRKPRRHFEPSWYDWHVDKRKKEHEMNEVVKELTIYFFYVAIVFLISYGNRDPNAYRVNLLLG